MRSSPVLLMRSIPEKSVFEMNWGSALATDSTSPSFSMSLESGAGVVVVVVGANSGADGVAVVVVTASTTGVSSVDTVDGASIGAFVVVVVGASNDLSVVVGASNGFSAVVEGACWRLSIGVAWVAFVVDLVCSTGVSVAFRGVNVYFLVINWWR